MNEQQINESFQLAKLIQDNLKKIGIWTGIRLARNKNNQSHFELVDNDSGRIYHVKFSREPFRAFGHYFNEFKGELGDSLNVEYINRLQDWDLVIFTYPNKAYIVRVDKIRKLNLLRVTKDGETTISFPLESCMNFQDFLALESCREKLFSLEKSCISSDTTTS